MSKKNEEKAILPLDSEISMVQFENYMNDLTKALDGDMKNLYKDDVDEILQKGIGKAKGEDFYSEEYKSLIKKEETYVETEEEKNIEKH